MRVDEDAEVDDVSQALAVLHRELDRIEDMPPGPAKTTAIREVAGAIQTLDARSIEIRQAEMLRIWKSQEISLKSLADKVGVSKARAQQVTNKHPKGTDDVR